MKASEISNIVKSGEASVTQPDADIERLLTDSRRLVEPATTLFFAIPTQRNTGCRYIDDLYRAGVRSFVVPTGYKVAHNDVNLWPVDDVVAALQRMAAYRRSCYHIPVVGITGSNGKTVVKDWLVQMLSADRRVVASPKSYNSQIGVPLSVWQMGDNHDIAIFEAGISQTGEMDALRDIIRPTIGIFTNIGQAHEEGFPSLESKIAEKLKLFSSCDTLIYCSDHRPLHDMIATLPDGRPEHLFTWGSAESNDLQLKNVTTTDGSSTLTLCHRGTSFTVTIPFVDRASRENVMHCIALMLLLGYPADTIARRCAALTAVEMRLEMDEAADDCLLINDSYSLDLSSLNIALDQLAHQRQHPRRTLIMSDIPQSALDRRTLYGQVAHLLRQRGVDRFIGIGPSLSDLADLFAPIAATEFYSSTDDFLAHISTTSFHDETILLKGARLFGFERIAKLLQRKSHETVMEVNLDALVNNLHYYRSRLAQGTRLMAMVKASSYGAGTVEVASTLQFNHVDYLTVAYIDEGVELRRGGITLPIMVMNPEPAGFDDIVRYRLEPDIYSFRILDLFADHLASSASVTEPFPIHIEFDTGMHRLGFTGNDVERLHERLGALRNLLRVESVFSHLACSEDPTMDDFTHRQIDRLREWSHGLPGIKHILNSSGISRFPEAQMDMVRLGIGLYGVAPEPEVQARLRQVSRLVTRISQIKDIPAGDTVGYNCRWCATRPSRIAILTIGYADGLHRGLGNGRGRVSINGHEAPIIGSVCMDMCFVDVTDVDCREGDRAVIFGEGDLLQRNATAAGTIPYELLTAVAPRVKRVYYHEE
jgi:alanine racemase